MIDEEVIIVVTELRSNPLTCTRHATKYHALLE